MTKQLTDIEILELAKQKKNEYQREWNNRKENRGKNAEYQRNYWIRKAKEELEDQENII